MKMVKLVKSKVLLVTYHVRWPIVFSFAVPFGGLSFTHIIINTVVILYKLPVGLSNVNKYFSIK